jgi:chorismate mutase
MATGKSSLEDLRRQIDRIDTAMHDLLMERASVVEQLGEIKDKDKVALLSPGREAEIIRRLLSRHRGKFPRATLVRLWRELISGMVAVQAPMTVAVFMPDRGTGYLELARDHYGNTTTMQPWRSPGQVIHAVAEGSAQVGILPMPDREEGESWWIGLTGDSAALPRIVARLAAVTASRRWRSVWSIPPPPAMTAPGWPSRPCPISAGPGCARCWAPPASNRPRSRPSSARRIAACSWSRSPAT